MPPVRLLRCLIGAECGQGAVDRPLKHPLVEDDGTAEADP
jgi:hypothetical protein